jgi:hypothetical protein
LVATQLETAAMVFHVRGDVEMTDCRAEFNRGHGFDVKDMSLIQRLGLSDDIEAELLFDWLSTLEQHPKEQWCELLETPTFWEKIGKAAPPVSMASSLLNIFTNPTFQMMIKTLAP